MLKEMQVMNTGLAMYQGRRFDIDEIALPDADFPHTMPTAPLFQRHMQLKKGFIRPVMS